MPTGSREMSEIRDVFSCTFGTESQSDAPIKKKVSDAGNDLQLPQSCTTCAILFREPLTPIVALVTHFFGGVNPNVLICQK